MYTTSYIRKKGKYYHLVFEYSRGNKKKSLSRSSKTNDEDLANKMLENFVLECMKICNIDEKNKPVNRKKILLKENINLYDSEISFCNFINGYVKMKRGAIAENTYSGYETMSKNSLIPYFYKENKKLKDINVFDIEKYYHHELNYRNVSANTVVHYHNLLSLIFKYALKLKIIINNPMLMVEKPKKIKYIPTTYSAEEINSLLNLLKEENELIYFGVLMSAYFGLRRSEIIGLKWSSINFHENTITIFSTVIEANIDGKHILTCKDKTKSTSSIRSFYLPEKIKEILLEMREKQKNNMEYLGRGYYLQDKDYIYVDDGGKRIRPNYLTVRFGKFLKKNHLKHIRLHDLRHSCATILYNNNTGIKEIQSYLGHSSTKTTMDIYVHLINRSNANIVGVLGEKIKI